MIEWGVERLPDGAINVCRSEEHARAYALKRYLWKEDRQRAARDNKELLDAAKEGTGPLPPTNSPWMEWENSSLGSPPIKDQEWVVVRRVVLEWEQV